MQDTPLSKPAQQVACSTTSVGRRNRKMQSIKVEVYRKSIESSHADNNPIDSFKIETQTEYNHKTPWTDNRFFDEFKDNVLPKIIPFLNCNGELDMRGFDRDNIICHPKTFEVTYNFRIAKGAAPESFVLKSLIQK